MQHIKLLAAELDSIHDRLVATVQIVDPKQRRHDPHVTVQRKDGLEVTTALDVGRHAVTQHGGIFGMQHQSAVDDVQKETDVSAPREAAVTFLKEEANEACPHVFVQKIQAL